MVKRVDPWSVLKLSLALSICLMVVFVIAIAILYSVLSGMGVFSSVTKTIHSLTSGSDNPRTDDIFTPFRVIGGALVIGAVNVVLMTALSTIGAFLYNVCADLVGGLDVTLVERD